MARPAVGSRRRRRARRLVPADDRRPAVGRPPATRSVPTQGTVVLWEDLDRLVGDVDADDEGGARALPADRSSRRDAPRDGLPPLPRDPRRSRAARQRQSSSQPWDPFMADHPSTQRFQTEQLRLHGHRIAVTPFVLPHHSKLTEAERAAGRGPEGWNAHQGFYVYRERRLLVAGDWLRLGGQKEEHAKLARIRIDLPNGLDAEWQIDVRKATARPPGPLRDRLRQIAEITRTPRRRGLPPSRQGDRAPTRRRASLRLATARAARQDRATRSTASIRSSRRRWPRRPALESVLRLAEETVPVPLIALQATRAPRGAGGARSRAPTATCGRSPATPATSLLAHGHDRRDRDDRPAGDRAVRLTSRDPRRARRIRRDAPPASRPSARWR